MSKRAFDKIMEGLQEVLSIEQKKRIKDYGDIKAIKKAQDVKAVDLDDAHYRYEFVKK